MTQQIKLKTPGEITIMAQGGKITAAVLRKVLARAKPGITTLELDQYAERLIKKAGGEASFKTVDNYRFTTCLCVNEVVVHGLPSNYRLQKGDVLGVDLGVFYRGYHTDVSWTKLIQEAKTKGVEKFLKVGETALEKAIRQAKLGNRVGDISQAIEAVVESSGYSVVRNLVGHGIGRQLHEDPEVPCLLQEKIDRTPVLKEGMVLAIEAIYNQGGPEVVHSDKAHDRWTIVTKDGSLSASFEHTVAITKQGPRVLTLF